MIVHEVLDLGCPGLQVLQLIEEEIGRLTTTGRRIERALQYPVLVPAGDGQDRFFDLLERGQLIEGDEAGIGVKFADRFPLSLSFGAGLGEGRDNGDLGLLKGTPTLENTYRLFGGVTLDLPFAELSSTVTYFPITADYDEADRSDEDYSGMLVDFGIGKEWFRIPFIVQLGGGISWMNSEYAQANYSVDYATDRLDTFKAESGLHSVNLSSTIVMFFSERMGTALIGEGKYLLNGAADSPLTKNEFDTKGWNRSIPPIQINTILSCTELTP